MSFGIILILLVILAIAVSIYVVRHKSIQAKKTGNAVLDKINPKRVVRRNEAEEKEYEWRKALESMTLSELNTLKSRLIKKNTELMKSGRDLKAIEAQNEIRMKQKIVEEKLKTMKGV